jgi:cullin-associated NEDD8-dissociated protein 1
MNLVVYDPNYIYDDNDEDMGGDDDDGDWGSDFDDGDHGGMDDDDDTSWKVRRGAVSVMGAIIKSRPEFHRTIFEKYSVGIVRRFRERVDDVKVELMESYD